MGRHSSSMPSRRGGSSYQGSHRIEFMFKPGDLVLRDQRIHTHSLQGQIFQRIPGGYEVHWSDGHYTHECDDTLEERFED